MEKKWEAKTSKWKAAIEKGLDVELNGKENILYLGASSGTTVEQLALRTSGNIYAVEKSYQMAIPLVKLAQKQEKVLPMFCDARDIDYIKSKIGASFASTFTNKKKSQENLESKGIDILFCDIPSRDQVEILTRAATLVPKGCKMLLSLKTQSISQKRPEEVKKEIEGKLKKNFKVVDSVSLEPFS